MMFKRLFLGLLLMLVVGAVSCKQAKVTPPASWSVIDTRIGRTLWWVDRNGREEAIQAPPSMYFFPKISPDGTKLVFTAFVNGDRDVWTLDLDKGNIQRMTFYERSDNQPLWSPDGQRIVFSSETGLEMISKKGGIGGILSKAADGTGEAEFLSVSPGKWLFPLSWKEDGKTILMSEAGPNFQNMNIGMLSLEGDRPYTLLLKEDCQEVHPQFSPDGRWLAYASDESGTMEIYVRPFPNINAGKWQISTDGGNSPRWSPNGKELYYLIGENIAEALMAVEVETKPTFSPGKPKVLFRGKYLGSLPNNGIPYDVHPDGRRFLMMKDIEFIPR